MKLLLDVGNTRLKWRMLQDEQVIGHGAVALEQLSSALWRELPPPDQITGACVAATEIQSRIEQHIQGLWALSADWLQVSAYCGGVRNHYQSPGLGVDRWASAIAAYRRLVGGQAAAALAINAGTAITIDVVSADGDYLGGSILPGLQLMRSALASGTARLPLAEGRIQDLPLTTEDAISTGIVDAACGAIERLQARVQGPVLLLLSGGDAHRLAPHLPAAVHKVENLVLDGLQVIRR